MAELTLSFKSNPTTQAPFANNSLAVARPMPEAAPVTTATLPVKSFLLPAFFSDIHT